MSAIPRAPNGVESVSAADATLVARALSGDRPAFGTLVERYQLMLYRHGRGMGLDHETSLDMAQDAFVRAYLRLRECQRPEHFRAWLFRICRNLSLDHVKNIRRRTVELDDLSPGQRPVDAPRSGLACIVREALDRLSPSLREAFLLKHDAGHTYEEVAAITGASTSAVKMRVHRARAMLRAMLLEEDDSVAARDEMAVADRL